MATDRFGAFLGGVPQATRRALEELRRRIDTKVDKSGDTMTGNLNVSNTNSVVGLIDTDGVTGGSMNASVRFFDQTLTRHGFVGFGTASGIMSVQNDSGRLWIATAGSDEVAIQTAGTDRITASGTGTVEFPNSNFGAWTGVSHQNSFADYGSPFQVVQYRKVGDIVQVRGLLGKAATWSTNVVVFNLPTGYRPPATQIWVCMSRVDEGAGIIQAARRVNVSSNGDVSLGFSNSYTSSIMWCSFHHEFSVT